MWWTGLDAGDWSRASAVDRDCASGLVSSLVISVVIKMTFSLRKLRPALSGMVLDVPAVHSMCKDDDHDTRGAQRGHTRYTPLSERGPDDLCCGHL